ncbi:hypothetical protein CPB85DRAFT_1314271 [Mucidula mucida]|nr:hypothetical protein CPB85DRAFT_1314271 [Mucidula mucida]
MKAPSKDTSLEASLPVVPPTPVRAVAKLLTHALSIKQDLFNNDDDDTTGLPDSENPDDDPFVDWLETVHEEVEPVDDSIRDGEGASGEVDQSEAADGPCAPASSSRDGTLGMEAAIKEAVEMLQKSSLSLCMKSSSAPLELKVNAHIPMSSTDADALAIMPKTANEIQSEAERLHLRQRTVELQAANILNEVYCKSLREQLAFQDEKKRKGKGKGKLVGDGLPVLLTSDEFYERVVEFEKAQIQKERGKEERAANKESLQKELEEWKVLVEEREEWIKNRRLAWAKEKEDHAAEKAKWALNKKAGKVKGKFTKPTPKLGPLPDVIPKPKLQTSIADDEAELDVADGDEGQRGNDDSDDSE